MGLSPTALPIRSALRETVKAVVQTPTSWGTFELYAAEGSASNRGETRHGYLALEPDVIRAKDGQVREDIHVGAQDEEDGRDLMI